MNSSDEQPADLLEIVPAELDRCSTLTGELARLLLPAHLFG